MGSSKKEGLSDWAVGTCLDKWLEKLRPPTLMSSTIELMTILYQGREGGKETTKKTGREGRGRSITLPPLAKPEE